MPLSSTDIKKVLLDRDVTIAKVARRLRMPREVLSRIIHAQQGYQYESERQRFARYLGIPVDDLPKAAEATKKAA